MSSGKKSFEDSLQKKVVSQGRCASCGACVVVCPYDCLEIAAGRPSLKKKCEICGICAQVCPQYDWSQFRVESFVFGRERSEKEEFGIYSRVVLVKAKNSKLLKVCQDGGVVTALLFHALKSGLIDGAVVSGVGSEKPFYPIPKVASTPQEILRCAGSRYSYSPNLLALADAAKQKKKCLAFVGTPCQINAVRKMQMLKLKRVASLKILIGLMCSECFSYEGLMEKHVHRQLGIDLGDIQSMNIKGKLIIRLRSGVVKTVPLAEIRKYARESCGFCRDFSSELADISTGGLGMSGRTFTIIRTDEGDDLFSRAEKAGVLETKDAEAEQNALDLLRRLSEKKRSSDCR